MAYQRHKKQVSESEMEAKQVTNTQKKTHHFFHPSWGRHCQGCQRHIITETIVLLFLLFISLRFHYHHHINILQYQPFKPLSTTILICKHILYSLLSFCWNIKEFGGKRVGVGCVFLLKFKELYWKDRPFSFRCSS